MAIVWFNLAERSLQVMVRLFFLQVSPFVQRKKINLGSNCKETQLYLLQYLQSVDCSTEFLFANLLNEQNDFFALKCKEGR